MPALRAFVLLLAGLAWAAPVLAQIARVLDTKGANMVERAGKPPRILGQGEQLDEKDVISVARDSYAVLEFRDQTRITLRPNTVFRLDTYRDKESESMLFGLVKGGFRAVTGLVGKSNPKAVNFTTATATIGIRGTEFDARLCEDDCAADERLNTRPTYPVAARLIDLKGSVVAVNVEGVERKLVAGSHVRQFDEVRTARDSDAVFLLRDGGRLVLHPFTRVTFSRFKYEPSRPADAEVDLMLLAGRIGTQTGAIGKARPVGYRITTRLARLDTRGTATEISCIRACAEPDPRAAVQPRSAAPDKPPARAAGLTLPAPTARPTPGLPAAFSAADWRTQAMTPEAKQSLVDYAQQAGLNATARFALQTSLNASPRLSYQQLQQRLQQADPATWGDLLGKFTTASGPEALVISMRAPLATPDWHTQAVAEQVKQALVAYTQNQGGDVASLQQLLNQSPPITYAQLQQAFEQGASVPYVASLAQNFAAASGPVALLSSLNTLDWRSQPISEQTRQAIVIYLQQMGTSAGDAAGFAAQLSASPSTTYAQLEQVLQQVGYMWPWAAPLATLIAGAGDVAALNNTLSTTDWRMQPISEQAQQAIVKYALDQGLPASAAPTISFFLAQQPPLTYGKLQEFMQQANEPWALAVAAAVAGASSVDGLVSTLDWRAQPMSAEAWQALVSFAQQIGVPVYQSASDLASMYSSYTYEQVMQMLQSDPNWAPIVGLYSGVTSPQGLVAALSAPPDWRLLPMPEPLKQSILAYVKQQGGDVDAMQQALIQYPTYASLLPALQAASGFAPWVASLAQALAGVGSVDELIVALPAPDWRTQPMSLQAKQALVAFAVQLGLYGAEILLDMDVTYEQLQQMVQYDQSWAEVTAVFAGASSEDALIAALAAPTEWRTQAISEQAKQAIQAYAQQQGMSPADAAGLQMVLNQSPPMSYAVLQQALEQANYLPWTQSLASIIASAGSADALVSALNSTIASTPETPEMEVAVSDGAVEVYTATGTQTVSQGQTASINRPGSPLLLANASPKSPAAGTPDIHLLRIDSGRTFGDEPPANPERGLYVWVREGAVELAKGGQAVDVAAGSAGVATADRVVLLDTVPNFMRFDATPRPLPAGSVRVADAFVAADGSQASMCIIR